MTIRGLFFWFCACLCLALASRWEVSRARQVRCGLDGTAMAPIYRVDLLLHGEVREHFCSVRCAREWPEAVDGATWRVRDEVTGEVLDATVACFVRSSVVTVAPRKARTHSFKKWSDAMEHIAVHGGERIANPFLPTQVAPVSERVDP